MGHLAPRPGRPMAGGRQALKTEGSGLSLAGGASLRRAPRGEESALSYLNIIF